MEMVFQFLLSCIKTPREMFEITECSGILYTSWKLRVDARNITSSFKYGLRPWIARSTMGS